MELTIVLNSVAALLLLSLRAVALHRWSLGFAVIYGVSLAISLTCLAVALLNLLAAGAIESVTLPLGLPWLGAHFRVKNTSIGGIDVHALHCS